VGIFLDHDEYGTAMLSKFGEGDEELEFEYGVSKKQKKYVNKIFEWYRELTHNMNDYGDFQKLSV
jgi:hypothetical protein